MQKIFITSLFTLSITIVAFAQKNINGNLVVNNTKRDYILHLPPGYMSVQPLPLVMIFHGGGGNSEQMQKYFGMDAIADKEKFITVYPNSINKNWNDGREFKEAVKAIDDVDFINRLLDTLEKNYAINTRRIFATGISNGGFFSYYLSYKMSNRLLAVSPVCASIPEQLYKEFYPPNPISIMMMNGTKDPLVPYEGGKVGNVFTGSRGNCSSTTSTLARYIEVNHTNTTPEITTLENRDNDDGCTAVEYTYSNGNNNTSVILVKVINGGHAVPGCSQYLSKFIIGKVCKDFNGNEMIWSFFKDCVSK